MIIKLKGDLEPDLLGLGLKPGDEIKATPCKVSKVGAMHFDRMKAGTTMACSVWPENYDIISE